MTNNGQYSLGERRIAKLLSSHPSFKMFVKKLYQQLQYLLHKKPYVVNCVYDITEISHNTEESFFGYYDKSPINKSNTYILFYSSKYPTSKIPSSVKCIELVLYDIERNQNIVIDSIYSYNWQQGSKAMWISDREFIYNNYSAKVNKYVSKIYNIDSKVVKIIDYPIYDAYKNIYAISLNYERLNISRSDYAYRNRNVSIRWDDNDNDGLYFIDIKNNTAKIVLSLNDIIKHNYKTSMSDAKHKFNHIMISPNGNKVMFMHRWFTKNHQRFDTLYVSNIDGSEVMIIADDEMVSHCYWLNNEMIIAYLRDKVKGDKYYSINIFNQNKVIVGEGVIDKYGDGHPTVHKDKLVFDTYPNKSRMKELFLFSLNSREILKIGEFFESFKYYV